jgi:NAD+--asparagine ADP-ribosyltransferase
MKFDIDETLANMLKAIKAVVKDNWNMVKDNANTYLQDRRLRLELLASLRLTGEIEEEFFKKRLKDEKKILESELHSVAIMSKSIAQKAANAALDVMEKAISTALKL